MVTHRHLYVIVLKLVDYHAHGHGCFESFHHSTLFGLFGAVISVVKDELFQLVFQVFVLFLEIMDVLIQLKKLIIVKLLL